MRSRERLVSKFGAVDAACDPTDDLSAFIPVPARSRPRLLASFPPLAALFFAYLVAPRRLAVAFLSLFKTSRRSRGAGGPSCEIIRNQLDRTSVCHHVNFNTLGLPMKRKGTSLLNLRRNTFAKTLVGKPSETLCVSRSSLGRKRLRNFEKEFRVDAQCRKIKVFMENLRLKRNERKMRFAFSQAKRDDGKRKRRAQAKVHL